MGSALVSSCCMSFCFRLVVMHTEVVAAKEQLAKAMGLARAARADSCEVNCCAPAMSPAPLCPAAMFLIQNVPSTQARRETIASHTPRLGIRTHRRPAQGRPLLSASSSACWLPSWFWGLYALCRRGTTFRPHDSSALILPCCELLMCEFAHYETS